VNASGELAVVEALRSLSVFGVSQEGAYREHFENIARVLGPDVSTKLVRWVCEWARLAEPGILILTGNAGTGKTAVAQAYCSIAGSDLPSEDNLLQVAKYRWVVKDLSGMPTMSARTEALKQAWRHARRSQVLVCANEGVLRRALQKKSEGFPEIVDVLDQALRRGAAKGGACTIVNVNRQRPTADGFWIELLEFLTRAELWIGCKDCPRASAGCPMMANAESLRRADVRDALRILFRYASGTTTPTLREVLSLIAWTVIGDRMDQNGLTCQKVKDRTRDLGEAAFDAKYGYFSLLFGSGLPFETVERSPLLNAIRSSGLGEISDLEADDWLRDPQLGSSTVSSTDLSNRVLTTVGVLSFDRLGETLSTSEDQDKVDACLDALTDQADSAMVMWRRKIFFERTEGLGGIRGAIRRLLSCRYAGDLLDLADRCGRGHSSTADLLQIVKGLNMLVTGFPNIGEGLIVPDSAGLFSRDPGAFTPARPAVVHTQIPINRFSLRCPDRGLVTEILDIDHIEIELVVDDSESLYLTIVPEMYECIRQAEAFGGPVGRGEASMAELRDFYSRLALKEPPTVSMRVADTSRSSASLVTVTLPHI
jgi:hypothetical protein